MESIISGMRQIHPGEVLREEFLRPLIMRGHALVMAIKFLRRASMTWCVSAVR